MPKNLLKRIITSFFLLSILFIVNFSHHFIFVLSILILGTIVCIEANNIFSKLIVSNFSKSKAFNKKLNFNFLILNITTFCYVFFVFCWYSYEIHRVESPTFFLYVISICFFTDIGGYLFGKVLGGKKLTKISPNKTISGSIGSFIFSFLLIPFFYKDQIIQNLPTMFVITILISLISQLGDLFISFLKRKAKVKDTSDLLPGHGGILDRIDGIIFAIPLGIYLFIVT